MIKVDFIYSGVSIHSNNNNTIVSGIQETRCSSLLQNTVTEKWRERSLGRIQGKDNFQIYNHQWNTQCVTEKEKEKDALNN